MCLIVFAYRLHPDYPLIYAGNRDEFYERPTVAAGFWEDAPHVLAGRDLRSQGTWLGTTRSGRWAAVTNYRDPRDPHEGTNSRGQLVSAYLLGETPPERYLADLHRAQTAYPGYNLLAGDPAQLYWYSNRGPAPVRLEPGLYGLSNHLLNSPWPKVTGAKRELDRLLRAGRATDPEALFALLADTSRPPDEDLPETGVPLEWERTLSSRFIRSATYGTRCSTLMLLRRDGRLDFLERSFFTSSRGWRDLSHHLELFSGEGEEGTRQRS